MPEDIENVLREARAWIGKESDITWARYPVEYEPIRRWCRMVDFANPLYLDEDYAKKTKWGSCVCPSFMIPMFAGVAEGTYLDWPFPVREEDSLMPTIPGSRNIGMGSEFRFFKPVRIGERLGSRRKLVDIYIKPTRFDPETFWLVRETSYLNQEMEVVAIRRGVSLRFRGSESKPKDSVEKVKAQRTNKDPFNVPNNPLSYNSTLHFEDVKEGQDIPGYSIVLNQLRFYLQASGSQNFGSFHTDEDYARKQGLATVFLDAVFTQAALSRLLSAWMGNRGWLVMLSLEMRRPNFLGDTIIVKGKVTGKYLSEDKGNIDCALSIENNREGKATWSTATIQLPLRDYL